MKSRQAAACILLLISGLHATARTWTNFEGKTIEAEYISSTGDTVTLSMNGKEIQYPLAKLSEADRQWISGLHATVRTWTNFEGKTIEAEYISSAGDTVTLSMNGREIQYPLAKLSEADREWIKAQPSPVIGKDRDASLDSQWVIMGNDGKLKYKTTSRGDRIMDYSHAGYMGGGVAIPTVPARITLSPKPNGDDSDRIQAAIDKVSKMRLVGHFRGAVLLKPGEYRCAKPLTIRASGVVLRGSGKGKNGTVISMTGEPHTCVVLAGEKPNLKFGRTTRITDDYVPSGANEISVKSAYGFSVGDDVMIRRTITKEWISFVGMDKLVRDGKPQTWIKPGSKLSFERTITGKRGNVLTLNTGLSDSIDAQFTKSDPATVHKIERFDRTSHIGVEDLRIVSGPMKGNVWTPNNNAIALGAIADSWVRNIYSHEPVSVVGFTSWDARHSTRVTIQSIDAYHSRSPHSGAKPASINILGSFYLIDRCTMNAESGRPFYYGSLGMAETAAVVLNGTFKGIGAVQPHMRWNTGLLVDSCKVPDGNIEFINRGTGGSGHGWTIGWAVAWNCIAAYFENHQAPGTVSWMIGCKGKIKNREARRHKVDKSNYGTYVSHGTHVSPESLYLAQLRERLGEAALKNIGY